MLFSSTLLMYFDVMLQNISYVIYMSWCCSKWWQQLPLLGNGVGG